MVVRILITQITEDEAIGFGLTQLRVLEINASYPIPVYFESLDKMAADLPRSIACHFAAG